MLGAVTNDGIDMEVLMEIEHCAPVTENVVSSMVPIWVNQFVMKSLAISAALRA